MNKRIQLPFFIFIAAAILIPFNSSLAESSVSTYQTIRFAAPQTCRKTCHGEACHCTSPVTYYYSSPYFCSPFLTSNWSPTSKSYNYGSIFQNKADAINATIISMESCLRGNYDGYSYNLYTNKNAQYLGYGLYWPAYVQNVPGSISNWTWDNYGAYFNQRVWVYKSLDELIYDGSVGYKGVAREVEYISPTKVDGFSYSWIGGLAYGLPSSIHFHYTQCFGSAWSSCTNSDTITDTFREFPHSIDLKVNDSDSPTIDSNDSSVDVNISWTANGLWDCEAFGDWSGSRAAYSSSEQVTVSSDAASKTYTLRCHYNNGVNTDSSYVEDSVTAKFSFHGSPMVTSVSGIDKSRFNNGYGEITIGNITGSNFESNSAVKLVSGSATINCFTSSIYGASYVNSTTFTNVVCRGLSFLGPWDLVVTNPNGKSGILANALTGLPGAPKDLSVSYENYGLIVRWNAPESNGGSAISGYNIYRYVGDSCPAKPSGNDACRYKNYASQVGNVFQKSDNVLNDNIGYDTSKCYAYYISAINENGEGCPWYIDNSNINVSSKTLTGVTVKGAGFKSGASVVLRNDLRQEIPCTGFTVQDNGTVLTGGTCELTLDTSVGNWDVVVINPDQKIGELKNGFSIVNQSGVTVPEVSGFSPISGTIVNNQVTFDYVDGKNIHTGALVKLVNKNNADQTVSCFGISNVSSYMSNAVLRYNGGVCDFSKSGTIPPSSEWYFIVSNPNSTNGLIATSTQAFTLGCVPSCSGKVCGSDGCGGTCGSKTKSCTKANVYGTCSGAGVQTCNQSTGQYGECSVTSRDPRSCSGKICGSPAISSDAISNSDGHCGSFCNSGNITPVDTTSQQCSVYFGSCPVVGTAACKSGGTGYDACKTTAVDPRIATCQNRVCGSDACGGYCQDGKPSTIASFVKNCTKTFGTCVVTGTQTCNSSSGQYDECQSTDPRIAYCSGKCSGSDNCGGTCSSICPTGQVCSNGYCITPACVPIGCDCGHCGNSVSDGCGGTFNCGCGNGYSCVNGGCEKNDGWVFWGCSASNF